MREDKKLMTFEAITVAAYTLLILATVEVHDFITLILSLTLIGGGLLAIKMIFNKIEEK